ncbi:hypothetical protein SEUCBS139899_007313 [Sporothrix eucalyptigena]|uniref:asparaginase n=1 Tax=Sporothrix eucalyptigena TaxID=1812306 RepID=A0ABP0C227_9PEZI
MDIINYGRGVGPTIPELVGNVSQVLLMAQISYYTFPSTRGSAGMNSSTFLNVTQMANKHLCSPDSDIDGLAMIHGTSTLEETAFGVDLTLNCSKPFVVVGSMRPDTYYSPDGRAKFYQAVAAAVSPESRDRGGMIVLNDHISSIFYSTKTNTNTPDTFKAFEQGNMGSFLGGQPYYYWGKSYPVNRPYFDVTNTTILPSVITLFGHQGFDASLMFATVANGAEGLVIIGPGPGSISSSAAANAAILVKQGIPVIVAARTVTDAARRRLPVALLYADYVSGEQARIMLQLAINANYTMDKIHDLFEYKLHKTIFGNWANKVLYGIDGASIPGFSHL